MNQNPIHEKGYRNVLCPDYRTCLDYAAKSNWQYWSCLDCWLKEKQNLVKDVCLSQGVDDAYYSLSPSLYQKVKEYSL